MTQHRKHIAYAYPTSTIAERLGMGSVGCFFVQEDIVEGGRIAVVNHDTGYSDPTDPECQRELSETPGTLCPIAVKYHPERYDLEKSTPHH